MDRKLGSELGHHWLLWSSGAGRAQDRGLQTRDATCFVTEALLGRGHPRSPVYLLSVVHLCYNKAVAVTEDVARRDQALLLWPLEVACGALALGLEMRLDWSIGGSGAPLGLGRGRWWEG